MNKELTQEEAQHLAKTIEYIDNEVQIRKDRSPAQGPYKEDARSLQEMDDRAIADYERIRPRPYFGRVDFRHEGCDRSDKRYIGTDFVPNHVFSWASPFAEQLYYADPKAISGYQAPKGHVPGSITLKRNYVIDNAKLLEIREIYQLLPPENGHTAVADSTQAFMIERLSGHRGRGLRETVATIQPEQYEQIAAAPGDVMLVQGVAGSGKSIVGLHRIAYLLSPFNKRPETRNLEASSVVFFGPTRAFLDYIGGLLPGLNVSDVPQLTVMGWLQGTLSRKVFLDRREPLLEKLLRHKGKRWRDAYEASKLKGSVQMSRLLERHVETLRKTFAASTTSLSAVFGSAAIGADEASVRRVARSVESGPLNDQRGKIIDGLLQLVWEGYLAKRTHLTREVQRQRRPAFIEQVRPQIEQQVATWWPELDFREEYRRLISNSGLLSNASKGKVGVLEASMLEGSLPRRPNVFSAEDLGPLSYLDHLLAEHAGPRFGHVVLDEAQEVSPIELMVIMQHTRGDAFTILGDLTQSLSPKGIDSWAEILRLFRSAKVSRYRVRTSYRSTREITRFANRLLKRVSPRAVTAEPFNRIGVPVGFNRSQNYKQMADAITADVRELREQGAETIGVLCKTAVDAKKLHTALRDGGTPQLGLLDREEGTLENVVVGPVSLTRGLEFDAVILAGAGKANYPSTPLHGKILYLAASRAAHQLRIHWVGQPASILPVRPTSRRKKGAANKPRPSRRRAVKSSPDRQKTAVPNA